MTVNEQYEERIEIFEDAVRMKKRPKRTPFVTNDAFWRYHDLGYKLSEGILNPENIINSLVAFQQRYNFDLMLDNGDRNPLLMTRSLGNFEYIIDDKNNTLMLKEQCCFSVDDYDKFVENPVKTLWENVLPRKYTYFTKDMKLETIQNTLMEFLKYDQQVKTADARLLNECGVPPIYDPNHGAKIYNAFECLYNFYRGMKGLSRDLRSIPDKVLAYNNVYHQTFIKPLIDGMTHADKVTSCFTTFSIMLSQNMVNKSQFEKFVWPQFKEVCDKVIETNNTMFVLSEGTTKHIASFLQQLPKGHFCFYVESDDIFEMRKLYPNLCLWGGIPLSLLVNGTKKQCIEHVRRVIEEVGKDGGLVLCTDKFATSPGDCNRENLLAVSEFIHNYR